MKNFFQKGKELKNKNFKFLDHPSWLEISQLPNYGYNISTNEYFELQSKNFYSWSLLNLSKYADYITKASLNEPWYKQMILNYEIKNEQLKFQKEPNFMLLSNLSYVALYAENLNYRKYCYNFIQLLRN